MFYNPRNGSILCCRSGIISSRCACQPLPAPEVDPLAIGGTVFIGQTNVGYECLTVGNCGDKGTLLSWGARFVTDDAELEDAMFFDPEVPHEGEVLEEGPDIVCRPHVGIDPQYFTTAGVKTGKVEIYERVLSGVPSAFCDVEVDVVGQFTGDLKMTVNGLPGNLVISTYSPPDRTWYGGWQGTSHPNGLFFKINGDGSATMQIRNSYGALGPVAAVPNLTFRAADGYPICGPVQVQEHWLGMVWVWRTVYVGPEVW